MFLPYERTCLAALAGVAVLGLTACDSGAPAQPTPDTSLLLTAGPQGYVLNPNVPESLDLDAARVATIADPDTLGTALGRNGFSGGESRVWQQGQSYETDLVFTFHTAAQARTVLEVEHQAMTNGLGVVASPGGDIPDSWAYTMFGSTRQGNASVFCQGVWFATGTHLFGITTCGPNPGDESTALARADLQLQRAQLLGGG